MRVGIASLLGLFWLATAPALAQGGPPAKVGVDLVIREPLTQTAPVIGRLVSRQAGTVNTQVAGQVATVLAQVGDRVRAGQPLLRLDTERQTLVRERARAAVREAEARLAAAEAQNRIAQQELNRLEGLRQSAAFSQARYEDTLQRSSAARSEVQRAAADGQRAQADLGIVEYELREAEIAAPFDGVVTARHTDVGAYLTVGAAVVTLLNDRDLEIEADVPQDRLKGLAPGRALDVTFDDGRTLKATVRAVVPEENPLTRTRAARFTPDFGDLGGALADNQSVTVLVPIGEVRDVVTVHKDAIVTERDRRFVYVVEAGDTVAQRTVQLGVAVGIRFEVLEGLSIGDRVVVRGNEGLFPGRAVTVSAPAGEREG